MPTPFPDPAAADGLSFGTEPKAIVEVLPQPLLLTAVAPPEAPLDPELDLPLAPESPVDADPPPSRSPSTRRSSRWIRPGVPELEPPPVIELPELDALPVGEAAASLSGELPAGVAAARAHHGGKAYQASRQPRASHVARDLVRVHAVPNLQWHQAPQSVTPIRALLHCTGPRAARPPTG